MISYENFNKDYAKEILSGKKKLLKLQDVKFISVIKYDELSVKHLYDKFLGLDGVKDYFPSKYARGRQCDRDYMFNVANTLHNDVVKELVEHALKQRHAINIDRVTEESILMNDYWKDELKSLPVVAHVSLLLLY